MKKFIHILAAVSLLTLSACGNNTQTQENEHIPAENNIQTEENIKTKAEKLLDSMTLEEKTGQLFIVRPEALQLNLTPEQINDTSENGATEFNDLTKETLSMYPAGGVVFFGKNVSDPEQLKNFTSAFQNSSDIGMFIGIDEEGGIVSRIASNPAFDVPQYESMQNIGETGDVEIALKAGFAIGSYLEEYGFNLDFAPVADTNTNPENIVIGKRSFGSDPDLVAEMVQANIAGLHQANIMSCVKHFPGHGDTKGDTHKGYVSIDKTWDELKQCELIPFINAFETTDMVMAAHITTPNITSDSLPASLSYEMITDKLRNELGYSGVVISDSMSMGAITQEYSSSDAAVKAILAGVDIILMPQDFESAYNGILNAVNNGEISEERIDESVLRILNLKDKYGLLE